MVVVQKLHTCIRKDKSMTATRGLISDFIQRMDQDSNCQPSYGLKVTMLELRDLGKRHLATYGETHVEELIHYLDELSEVIHPKARFAVKLRAESLQRRLEFQVARQQLEQEGLSTDAKAVFERAKQNHKDLNLEKSEACGLYSQQ